MPWQERIGRGGDCGRADDSRFTRTFTSGAEGEWVVYHLPADIPAGYWAQAMPIEGVGTRMQLMENQWLR
jgi:hypothetical protein